MSNGSGLLLYQVIITIIVAYTLNNYMLITDMSRPEFKERLD